MAEITPRIFDGDGVRLSALTAGSGPLVILLHGFPEDATAWIEVIALLAPHARVLAPDLRGFGGSDRPDDVAAYRLPRLRADLDRLTRGEPRFVLVGHDWGGVLAWNYAQRCPERLAHLVIVNAPYPALLAARIADTPAQAAASAYIETLVDPEAEARLAVDLAGFWTRTFAGSGLGLAERDRAVACWSRPGALTAMLNLYRANPVSGMGSTQPITVPTSVVWGMADSALLPCLLDGLDAIVADLQIERLSGVGHWVPQQRPDAVARAALDALKRAGHAASGTPDDASPVSR